MTTTMTNRSVLEHHSLPTANIEHLDDPLPILTGPQRQGDVLVVPTDALADAGEPLPTRGIPVVRGETSGGNAHLLYSLDGKCFWTPVSERETELLQGVLTVPAGASATLIHTEEHGVLAIGPGTYELRRCREFAGEWRRIAD